VGYDESGDVDLDGYGASMASYTALVAVTLAIGRLTGRSLPERSSIWDVVLGGLATHKLSRLLSRGSVAAPLRAPFTEFEEPAGMAEHHESARGESGFRHTVGALLTCPFCLGVWVATAYVAALGLAPRPARAAATVLGVVAVSDWLHVGWELARAGMTRGRGSSMPTGLGG
jgi:hypothetical protein